MIKAGALYFSIVIAFFIAILSASLIMLAAHYRNAYLKSIRFERLLTNLDAGVQYTLAEQIDSTRVFDLYGATIDSISLENRRWGIYSLGLVKSFILQDTLTRAFIIGKASGQDSLAIYLSDEDRPVSVNGETKITGNVKVPKSGIRKSYVDGKPYKNEEVVYGRISDSGRDLEKPNEKALIELNRNLDFDAKKLPQLDHEDHQISFFQPTKLYHLSPGQLIETKLHGNMIIYADSLVKISARADLKDILIFAPSIQVETGFKGSCQLFARDSISVGQGALFQYPSVLSIIAHEKIVGKPKISIAEQVEFNGMLLAFEEKKSALPLMIELGKKTLIKGEIYCSGIVKLEKGIHINGKVSCNRFMMQTPSTLYENFLIDIFINRKARNKYYLSTGIFDHGGANEILKWLN